jgi:hypothetical protein
MLTEPAVRVTKAENRRGKRCLKNTRPLTNASRRQARLRVRCRQVILNTVYDFHTRLTSGVILRESGLTYCRDEPQVRVRLGISGINQVGRSLGR